MSTTNIIPQSKLWGIIRLTLQTSFHLFSMLNRSRQQADYKIFFSLLEIYEIIAVNVNTRLVYQVAFRN